jgi:poly-beta-1,6-N-acetyl-D-glucosamine synthase
MRYVIVTPAKNEAEFIEFTIQSVLNQTLKPIEWIIVDDGSDDLTFEKACKYQQNCHWINVIRSHTFSEDRSGGAKVVRAFNYGFSQLKQKDYDFIVKLDGDVELPSDYFESVAKEFREDENLGLCGGIIMNKMGDKLIQEGGFDYHVRGALKAVRKDCFEQIGGFKPIWNWDGLDEMHALYLGWKTKTISKYVVHFRPTSNAYDPVKHAYRSGFEAFKMRNSYFLTLLRTIYRIPKKPLLINSFSYFKGYISALLKKEPHHIEKDLARFINKFHIRRIFKKYIWLR